MKKNKEKTGVKKQNSISKEDAQKVREIITEIEDDGRSEEFKLPVDFKSILVFTKKHLDWMTIQP